MRTLTLLAALLVGCVTPGDAPSASPSRARVADVPERPSPLPAIVDRIELPPVRPSARPAIRVPEPKPVVVPRGDGSRRPGLAPRAGTARSVGGVASWYDDGPGLYAAAGPALRAGNWRGRHVLVCAGAHCVTVVLSDWCQCYRNTERERVIDLSPAAFSRLATLSRGIVKVTVSW